MNKPEIKIIINPESNRFRYDIKIGKKCYRSEHIFPSEKMAIIIADQVVKSIQYSQGKKECIRDNHIP